MLAPAFLLLHVPEQSGWAILVSDLGYTLGFLIVILGRLQLFTENTITSVLPLLGLPSLGAVARTGRLWATVFAANMTGALVASALIAQLGLANPEQLHAILEVSHAGTERDAFQNLTNGVPAGFFIATQVWVSRGAPRSQFAIVFALTYLIAIGDFAHVVAGAVEVFMILCAEGTEGLRRIATFILPALVGNVIGGTGLFALLAYGQVRQELPEADARETTDADDAAEPPS